MENSYDKFLDRIEIWYGKYPGLTISNTATVSINTKDMCLSDMSHYTEFLYTLFCYCHDNGFRVIGLHEATPGGERSFIGIDILEEQNFESFCRNVVKYSYSS